MRVGRKPRRWGSRSVGLALFLTAALVTFGVTVPAQVAGALTDLEFTPPAPGAVNATSLSGAAVSWDTPVAYDEPDSPPGPQVSCVSGGGLISGSIFPVGNTTVVCTATDDDDSPISHSFVVTVNPYIPPDTDLAMPPISDPLPIAATGLTGAVFTFAAPSASDEDGPVPSTCVPASGSTFHLGSTTVTCTATDNDDTPNTASRQFVVTVQDQSLAIASVNSIFVAATGPGGATVNFTAPKATDFGGSVPVGCVPASGSTFPPGQSTVVCTATGGPNDVPATKQTSFGVYVNSGAPAPNPPAIGTATPGDSSASVAFGPPASNGSFSIGSYTVTCASSDGGTTGSGSGKNTPITVTGLSNGHTYTCTATASTTTNPPQTSGPSSESNAFVPTAGVVTCTDSQVCDAKSSNGSTSSHPAGSVDVRGTTDHPTGTISVVGGGAPVACPGSSVAVSPGTTMSDTGFSSSNSLTVTLTLFAVATGPAKVCYSSTVPFLSEEHPTTPTAGVGHLLRCPNVANQAPCVLSTKNTLSTVVVTILVPGGDPTFSVVVPTGRLVWPSTFPNGKVGTPYSTHLLSKGGKAPFHWKISSGKLPPGLSINAGTGTVGGKPTTKGTFKSVVHVTDSEAPPQSANISVSITIT